MGKIGNAYSALFWVGCEMESSHFFSCNLSTRRLLGGGIRPFPYSRELIGRDSYFSQINGHDVLKFDVLLNKYQSTRVCETFEYFEIKDTITQRIPQIRTQPSKHQQYNDRKLSFIIILPYPTPIFKQKCRAQET